MPNIGQVLVAALKAKQADLFLVSEGKNVADAVRQNAKRPARLLLNVPDDTVKNLRGRKEDRDLLLIVRIPRPFLRQLESPILQPTPPPRPVPGVGAPLIVPGR